MRKETFFALVSASALFLCSCPEEPEFPDVPDALCEPSERAAGAIDVLFVVDNSGGTEELHEKLVDGFYEVDAARCPIDDLSNVAPAFLQPSDELVRGTLAECGFLQMLAAFEVDFRIGVIT